MNEKLLDALIIWKTFVFRAFNINKSESLRKI